MNKLIAVFKRIRLSRILVVFAAGALLIFNTACSRATNAAVPGTSATERNSGTELRQPGAAAKNPRPEVPNDPRLSRPEGGMNDFSDVDPRTQNNITGSKTKALIDNAERNVIDETGNVGETTRRILGKKGENAEDFGKNLKRNAEDIQDKAKSSTEDFAKGTREGARNVKDNTLDATKGASRAAEDVKDNTKRAANRAGEAVSDTVD